MLFYGSFFLIANWWIMSKNYSYKLINPISSQVVFFIVWPYICCVNPFLHLYYITESSLALSHLGVTGFGALGRRRAWKEKAVKQREIVAEKLSGLCLLISYKRPNNLNGDLEVTYANENLDRKVTLFSFHIHIYQSKRCISRLWFLSAQHHFHWKMCAFVGCSYWV